ncbi:hypothetical protein HR45_00875 [Shewanella mangrovi]|uniref:HTH merR-type domain-containing protein n=1 Tax=Shewanella mangrovi TaxID=1515746 RepID=A0A094JIG4_9GAMM|nr:MerR family transcriptional regulator [Shewanella mangrovi]KFZ38987.1 hypothetical protein HR45_00875 [Shewanella mangrovi]
MYIGEMSRRSGASAKAIRLYESLGLLRNITRRGNYRVYEQADVEFVLLIKQAQTLGISLAELQRLVAGRNLLDWSAVHTLLDEKSQRIDAAIAALQQQQANIASCR